MKQLSVIVFTALFVMLCGQSVFAGCGNIVYFDNGSIVDDNAACPDGAECFTEGVHTHIIHPDYRCSNNQCWESGGETNCWDAYVWYEINNGDVTDVTTVRDRDMCAEVYNSGEPDYVPPTETVIDPGHSGGGGMNDMKIKTVNMSKGSKSERHSTLYQDPGEKFYAYAKLDNDGSATAYDFKLRFYIDGGKRNTDGDDEDYIDKIRIDEYRPDAKIRYSMELTAPDEPGTYWVYACITSIDNDEDEDNNCSGEDDREEFGKLIVGDVYEVPEPTGKPWAEMNAGERAAIMLITGQI